jgi:hypothetical protein
MHIFKKRILNIRTVSHQKLPELAAMGLILEPFAITPDPNKEKDSPEARTKKNV